jgi:hypothetical protein
MEKELVVIDGILSNLAGIQSFYEFEHAQLLVFYNMLKQFQNETLKAEELEESNDIFTKETNKEITTIEMKLTELTKKIDQIKNDIKSRTESKTKLIDLFKALKSVDSLDGLSFNETPGPPKKFERSNFKASLPIMEIREELDDNGNVLNSEVKTYGSTESGFKSSIEAKIKDSKKELQKKSVTVEPENLNHKKVESKKLETKKTNRKQTEQKPQSIQSKKEPNDYILEDSTDTTEDPNNSNFRPFMIREEIDEDGNIIKSSMSRIPQITPTEQESESMKVEELENGNDDELMELFEDMGLQVPRNSVTNNESEGNNGEENEKNEENTDQSINNIEKVPLKDNDLKSSTIQTANGIPLDTNDLYTLELIADELNQQDSSDIEQENDEGEENLVLGADIEDYELPVIDGTETGDDEDYTDDADDEDIQQRTLSNMFGSKGQNLFTQQLLNLRGKNANIPVGNITENVEIEEVRKIVELPDADQLVQEIPIEKNKSKKSVSFNSTVDVKKVPDIWDDLRKSNVENEIRMREKEISKSLFKRSISSNESANEYVKVEGTKKSDTDAEKVAVDNIISDIVERQVVDNEINSQSLNHNDVFKTFDSASLRKQLDDNMSSVIDKQNMKKLSGKRGPSKFKMARAVELGKKFQETHVPAEIRDQLQTIVQTKTVKVDSKLGKKELKTNLKSLKQNHYDGSNKSPNYSIKIEAPKDINPLPVNPLISDEDYEIIRNETTDGLFDDDDDVNEEEFIVSETNKEHEIVNDDNSEIKESPSKESANTYFPKYKGKGSDKTEEVIGATLDYKSLSDDLETMAKAYVLGLYDDDIQTSGEVIEELKDFEDHNKIVENIKNSKLHQRVEEINKRFEDPNGKIEEILEDNNPMMVSDIVENDVDEILKANAIPDDQLDIELNDETLTTQVALDYVKVRSNMIHKYNGGFKETDKEKEFVRPEGGQRISRFKSARLGIQ